MSKKINNTPRRLLTASMSLALLISLSSCSGATNTTGNLEADKTYASAGKVTVTYGDIWNELQWNANTVLNEQITNVVLNEKISKINSIMTASSFDKLSDKENLGVKNEDEFTNLKKHYEERLVDYVVQDIYDQTFSKDGYWDAVNDMKEKSKQASILKYIDNMYLTYHKDHENLIANKDELADKIMKANENETDALLELAVKFNDVYYPLLAKELLAYENLEEQIKKASDEDDDKDDDKEGYFTHSQFKTKFESEYSNTYNLDLVMIRFTSEKEFEDTLRAFGIKIHDKKYYFVDDYADGDDKSKDLTYEEYIKRYDDIKDYTNPNGVYEINDDIVLELYIHLYNYIYGGYKAKLPTQTEFKYDDMNALRANTYKVIEKYNNAGSVEARNALYKANVDAVKAATQTKTNYTSEELNDISSTYKDYLYETLKTPDNNSYKEAYSTSTQSANSGYYIAYKFDDDYDKLEGKAKEYEDYFRDAEITSYEAYEEITKEGNEALYEEILKMLKKDQLSDTLINTALDEEKKDIKIKIYNEALEISYKKDHPDYSKTLKGADKNLLAAITYNDKTYNLNITANADDKNTLKDAKGNAIGAFEILEEKSGSTVAIDLIADKIVKDTPAYEEALKDKESIDYYEEYLDTLLVNFANGGLAQQGYDATIGKYDFLMLYFHTADVNEIVENHYLVQHAASKLLTDYSSIALAQFFNKYTDLAYEKYFSLSGSRLVVYMDNDDDNEADDAAAWANEVVKFKGEDKTRAEVAKELVYTMYNKLSASTVAHKDRMTQLVDEFNNSARASFDNNPIAPENNWAEYKHLGFKLKVEEFAATNSDVEIDRALKDRLYDYARGHNEDNTKKYEFFKNGVAPTAYLEPLNDDSKKADNNDIIQSKDGFNLILVTAGQARPSAKWTEDKNDDKLLTNITLKYNGSYTTPIENVYNDGDKLNLNQIRLFLIDSAVNGSSTMSPTSTSQALTTFLNPVVSRYSTAESQRIILLNFIKVATDQKEDTNLSEVITYAEGYNGEGKYLDNVIKINQNIVDNYNSIYNDPTTNVFEGWWDELEKNIPNFIASSNKEAE